MRHVLIVFLAVALLMPGSGCSRHRAPERMIGIKIYDYDGDFGLLAEQWDKMGINTAFVSKDLAANAEFRQVLKEHEIKTFIIFPVFYDPAALKEDSSLYAITDRGRKARESWVEFVCPSRHGFRNRKIREAADLARELKPDGMSIDFIRHFVFWEMIYPDRTPGSIDMACFCDSCTGAFLAGQGISLPDSCIRAGQKSEYIIDHYKDEWNDYRTGLIASMAEGIADALHRVNPDLKIMIHAVPWRDADFDGANIRVAGQDLKKLAACADYISPMCYSQMLRRDAGWISSVVKEADGKAPGMIVPSIQVYPAYIDDPFSVDDFRRCVDAAVAEPSLGVIFFSWPLFERDPERIEAVRF